MSNGPPLVLESPATSAPIPEVRNHTQFPSQYYQMLNVDDIVFHVLVSRVTYDLTRLDTQGIPQLAKQQASLVDADQFYNEPNSSSLIQESDFAPFKPKCDILFAHTSAYAPEGRPHKRWSVGAKIGQWSKLLSVTGPRSIRQGILGWSLTEPAPATEVPLRYELAFGGSAQWPEELEQGQEPELQSRYAPNPIGSGWLDKAWLRKRRPQALRGPQLEVFGHPLNNEWLHKQSYHAIGLGAIGRWWQPRVKLAGTYDQAWKESRWPFLPKDFDFAYWNCAPKDQQIDYPQGGEDILLAGLTPDGGQFKARLPHCPTTVIAQLNAGPRLQRRIRNDSIIFDMKHMTLSCVYRSSTVATAGVQLLEIFPRERG